MGCKPNGVTPQTIVPSGMCVKGRACPGGTSRLSWRFPQRYPMSTEHPNDPLHGKTLEHIVNALVAHYTWAGLGERIEIRCFTSDPSVNSSLKFLRKTPWARKKVEDLYLAMMATSQGKRKARR